MSALPISSVWQFGRLLPNLGAKFLYAIQQENHREGSNFKATSTLPSVLPMSARLVAPPGGGVR